MELFERSRLTSRYDIRQMISDGLESIKTDPYPDDRLSELADTLLPIYTADIIAEWGWLEWGYVDRWLDYGLHENATIAERMTYDLHAYYSDAVRDIYNELTEEGN